MTVAKTLVTFRAFLRAFGNETEALLAHTYEAGKQTSGDAIEDAQSAVNATDDLCSITPCCGRPVFTTSPALWEAISMHTSFGNCAAAAREPCNAAPASAAASRKAAAKVRSSSWSARRQAS